MCHRPKGSKTPGSKSQVPLKRSVGFWSLGVWKFRRETAAGWSTGLEPATTRITIWGSTIELRPPRSLILVFGCRIAKAKRKQTGTFHALTTSPWRKGALQLYRGGLLFGLFFA